MALADQQEWREACAKEPSAKRHRLLRLPVHSGFLVLPTSCGRPSPPTALDGTSASEPGRLGLPGVSLARENDLQQTGGCHKEVLRASEQPVCAEKHPRAAKGGRERDKFHTQGTLLWVPAALGIGILGLLRTPQRYVDEPRWRGKGFRSVERVGPCSLSSKKRAIH